MNVLPPLSKYPSPSGVAVVLIAIASEPADGSEIAWALMISPSISRAR